MIRYFNPVIGCLKNRIYAARLSMETLKCNKVLKLIPSTVFFGIIRHRFIAISGEVPKRLKGSVC